MGGPHPDLFAFFVFCIGVLVGFLGRKMLQIFKD